MKQTFILLCIPLILGGCNEETSPVEDSTRVALQPNITTAAPSRSIVNGIGTGDDKISTISIYVTRAADNTAYPGAPGAAVFSAPASAGQPWTTTPAFYVNATEGRLYACSPSNLTVTGNAPAVPTVPVSIPAAQTFDGASTTACSTVDYLYGSASNTTGQAEAISVSSTNHTPTIYLQHALSQLVFTMVNASDRPADADNDYVKSITLVAENGTPFSIATEGKMSLADGSMTDTTNATELSFAPSANPARPTSTSAYATVAYGLVIPQTATSGGITVKVLMGKASEDATNDREYTVSAGTLFDAAWEKGKRYTYRLILGNHNMTLGTVEIGEWLNGTGGSGEMPPEGTRLQVVAGIGNSTATQTTTRTATSATAYDRIQFLENDVIRITRTKSGTTTSDYTLAASGSWDMTSGTEFTFESAATYSAVYPPEYTAILSDQRTAENFRLSNRLVTPAGVRADRTGKLCFTDADKFTHANSRITLKLKGTDDIAFGTDKAVLTLKGTGIYSGGSAQETIYPLRPDAASATVADANTWCAILSPLQAEGSRDITVALEVSGTDGGTPFTITYSCTVTCACLKDTHYSYTLSVVNDRLVPEGAAIEGWHDADNGYAGDFDSTN